MQELTVQERIDFSHLERDIENGKTAALEMAQALLEIHNRRLYREIVDTFEEYCEQRWQFTRQYGYCLCDYAESIAQLTSLSTTVYIPQNEWQARPLRQLESAEEKADSVNAAAAIAPNNHPDAGHIKRAVVAVKSKPAQSHSVGARVTVLDEASEHYGKTVEVVKTDSHGVIVQCRVEGAENPVPFLHNEVGSTAESPKTDRPTPQPDKPKLNPIAGLQSELDIERLRVELLEAKLMELIGAIEQSNEASPRLKDLAAEIKTFLV